MSFSTITITGAIIGAKTLPPPSTPNVYAPSTISKFDPIDGNMILQVSNNRDSYGDKNSDHSLVWDALLDSSSLWTMTIAELKSLEGTDAVIDGASCLPYTTTQSIRVSNVSLDWLGWNGSVNVWRAELVYTHL